MGNNLPKSLSSLFLLLAIAVASVMSLSATAKADTPALGNNVGQVVRHDWTGRLRGRIQIVESVAAVGRATYKIEATSVNLDGDVVQLRTRVVRLRAGQSARVGYGLPVERFGREAELEVAVWRQDGESWTPVGETSLTLRRRARVWDTLVIGDPVTPPPTGFSGLILENRMTGASAPSNRFSSIDFGRSTETVRYTVNFAPTAGEPQGPTTSVDPGEDAKIAASAMSGAGFGAGTYTATIRWSDGSTSVVTWPAWSGSGAVTVTVNDNTPRAMP